MYLLNYIYFLIITLLGLKFLTMKRGVMVNPLNREQKMVMDGPEMFWVLTFSTGLLALSAPGALDLMAIRLMVLEIFCIVGLFICKRSPQWSPAIVRCLVSNRVELFSGSRIWIPGNFEIPLSSVNNAFCFGGSAG